MTYYNNTDPLAHHGIKGQRWGIRRFENEDRSLTPTGKKRYADNKPTEPQEPKKKSKAKKIATIFGVSIGAIAAGLLIAGKISANKTLKEEARKIAEKEARGIKFDRLDKWADKARKAYSHGLDKDHDPDLWYQKYKRIQNKVDKKQRDLVKQGLPPEFFKSKFVSKSVVDKDNLSYKFHFKGPDVESIFKETLAEKMRKKD